jgi:beta-lactamase class A
LRRPPHALAARFAVILIVLAPWLLPSPSAWAATSRRPATPPARERVPEMQLPPVTEAGVTIRNAAPDSTLHLLARDIELLAARAGGSVGLAIEHLESGVRLSLRGGERYPMASVYKLPIALEVLHRVACDSLSLEDTVTVTPADLRTGSGWIAERFRRHGPRFALGTLLEAMLLDSDNTASDLLLRIAGGPPRVQARLRALGVAGIRIDRFEIEMALDYHGVSDVPPDSTWTLQKLYETRAAVPVDKRVEAAAAWIQDPRDTTTPDAMVDLLVKVFRNEALGPDETSRLLEILERARTGPERLRGMLPPETPVSHKTGTWSSTAGIIGAVNDAGIIALPGDAGHLAIAVFVKASNRGPTRIERAIARIARAAYDHWVGTWAAAPARREPRVGG